MCSGYLLCVAYLDKILIFWLFYSGGFYNKKKPSQFVLVLYDMIGCTLVDMTSKAPTVTHVIPGDAPVTGVTSLGDDMFVVRHDKSQQVEVYDAVSFTLQRRLSVPGLGLSYGLAACASNKCLYASDFNDNCVHLSLIHI